MDIYNKIALGPSTVAKAYKSKSWIHRFFAAILAMSETNACLVHKQRMRSKDKEPLDHADWKEALAFGLFQHAKSVYTSTTKTRADKVEVGNNRLGLGHCQLVRTESRSNPWCSICRSARTAYYCVDCGIKTPIC